MLFNSIMHLYALLVNNNENALIYKKLFYAYNCVVRAFYAFLYKL